jgi:hypothetical protein
MICKIFGCPMDLIRACHNEMMIMGDIDCDVLLNFLKEREENGNNNFLHSEGND